MNIIIIPAVLGLVINFIVMVAAYQNPNQNRLFLVMVAVFVLMMLSEVLGFLEFFQGGQLEYLIRSYYVFLLTGLALAVAYAAQISNIKFPYSVLAVVVGGLTVLVLFTDYVVAGSNSIGHIRTAAQGPAYILFQLASGGFQIAVPTMLIMAYRKPRDHTMQIQCVYTLIGFLPIFLWSVTLLGLMAFGYGINAVFVMPLVVTFFVVLTLMSESTHKIVDVRRFIPFSAERKASNEIMEIYTQFNRDELGYRDAISQLEKLMVLSKYEKSGGNASATAKLLDLPRSSLYSIFARLEIDYKD